MQKKKKFYLKNHLTPPHSDERLVFLVRGSECFVGLTILLFFARVVQGRHSWITLKVKSLWNFKTVKNIYKNAHILRQISGQHGSGPMWTAGSVFSVLSLSNVRLFDLWPDTETLLPDPKQRQFLSDPWFTGTEQRHCCQTLIGFFGLKQRHCCQTLKGFFGLKRRQSCQ